MLATKNVRLRSDPKGGNERASGAKIEKILARRRIGPADDSASFEYLVKFSNVSYLHVEWLSPATIVKRDAKNKDKLKKFVHDWLAKGGADTDTGEYIDPSFVEVEKIVAFKSMERVLPPGQSIPQSGAATDRKSAPSSAAGTAGPAACPWLPHPYLLSL